MSDSWSREIDFHCKFGVWPFQKTLDITPDGFSWCGELLPFKAITRLRWGVDQPEDPDRAGGRQQQASLRLIAVGHVRHHPRRRVLLSFRHPDADASLPVLRGHR